MKIALPGAVAAIAIFSAGLADAQVNSGTVDRTVPESSDVLDDQSADVEAGPELEVEGRTGADAGLEVEGDQQGIDGSVESDGRFRGDADNREPLDDTIEGREDASFGATIESGADGGLRIQTVDEASAAAAAGLRAGDVITTVDGREFSSRSELNAYLQEHSDSRLRINVRRDGREETLFLDSRTRAQARAQGEAADRPALGVTLRSSADGIAVGQVMPGSPAARAGLRAGDRIVALNGSEYYAIDPFVQAMQGINLDGDAELVYIRDGQRHRTGFRPAPWGEVHVSESNQVRQSLRPDLSPAPAGGQIHSGYGAPSIQHRGSYSIQGNTYHPAGSYFNVRRCYDDDDWEDRYDD